MGFHRVRLWKAKKMQVVEEKRNNRSKNPEIKMRKGCGGGAFQTEFKQTYKLWRGLIDEVSQAEVSQCMPHNREESYWRVFFL